MTMTTTTQGAQIWVQKRYKEAIASWMQCMNIGKHYNNFLWDKYFDVFIGDRTNLYTKSHDKLNLFYNKPWTYVKPKAKGGWNQNPSLANGDFLIHITRISLKGNCIAWIMRNSRMNQCITYIGWLSLCNHVGIHISYKTWEWGRCDLITGQGRSSLSFWSRRPRRPHPGLFSSLTPSPSESAIVFCNLWLGCGPISVAFTCASSPGCVRRTQWYRTLRRPAPPSRRPARQPAGRTAVTPTSPVAGSQRH